MPANYGYSGYTPQAGTTTPSRSTGAPQPYGRDSKPQVYQPAPPQPKTDPDYGSAQSSVPQLSALYQQLLAAVGRQTAPASTVGGSNAAIAMYQNNQAQLAALQQQLLAQQGQMAGLANMPIADFSELEQQLLEQAGLVPQSRTISLYGFAG